jgi:hypothetical protein
MSLDTAMQTALDGSVVGLFAAVQIVHPMGTAYLLDGSGFLTFFGATWTGGSDIFGSLGALEVISDGSGEEAPSCNLSLLPPNASQMIALVTGSAQGGAVAIYVGCFNPTTGQVIGTPDLRFLGAIDTATVQPNGASSMVVFGLTSAFERFFDTEEAAKLSNSFHQTIWPGELGFQYMTNILSKMPWGSNDPRPAVIRA